MAKTYRVTIGVRASNAIVTGLLRAGVPLGEMALLTVRGRHSGVPRTTPVTPLSAAGRRYLVAPYGAVNWVQNLRAAGVAELGRGRRYEQIVATELGPEQAAPLLQALLREGSPLFRRLVRPYFHLQPDDPAAAATQAARKHPVFWIEPAKATE